MASPTSSQLGALLEAARKVLPRAYAPYSGFRVGAAALGASGRVHVGCNVESSSYGLTLCAERAAVSAAVAAGEREVVALAIYTQARRPTPPCGACRQVLLELCRPEAAVVAGTDGAERSWKLGDLLPDAFSGVHIAGAQEPSVD
jgi:cytidine deaminase